MINPFVTKLQYRNIWYYQQCYCGAVSYLILLKVSKREKVIKYILKRFMHHILYVFKCRKGPRKICKVYIKHYCISERDRILIKTHNLFDKVENAFNMGSLNANYPFELFIACHIYLQFYFFFTRYLTISLRRYLIFKLIFKLLAN